MKVITEIKWLDVPEDIWEISYLTPPLHPMRVDTESGQQVMSSEVVREIIRGTRIKNPFTGMDVILGVSARGADIIGCAYEAFEELQASVEAQKSVTHNFRRVISEIRKAGFLTRLKWLFTGVGCEL